MKDYAAILIDPYERALTLMQIRHDFDSYRHAIDCSWIELYKFAEVHDGRKRSAILVMDEEASVNSSTKAPFKLYHKSQDDSAIFLNKCLLIGDRKDCPYNIEELESIIKFGVRRNKT